MRTLNLLAFVALISGGCVVVHDNGGGGGGAGGGGGGGPLTYRILPGASTISRAAGFGGPAVNFGLQIGADVHFHCEYILPLAQGMVNRPFAASRYSCSSMAIVRSLAHSPVATRSNA